MGSTLIADIIIFQSLNCSLLFFRLTPADQEKKAAKLAKLKAKRAAKKAEKKAGGAAVGMEVD